MLTLVIPVYRNEASLSDLVAALDLLNTTLLGDLEVVFVIDGSPDRCYEILRDSLPNVVFKSKLVLLSRNFGSFAAIRAGLEVGTGDRFAVMAADLQEPPALIIDMNNKLASNVSLDVVVGVREARNDPLFSRLTASVFWSLYRRYVVPEIPPGGVDIFACTRGFRDSLLKLEERHSSLIAQIFWLGYRRELITYTRLDREHGKSAWTFRKKINYLMDSIFAFTDLPIRILTRVGGVTALLAVIFGIIVMLSRFLGEINVPGYAITILSIVFFGSVNLFGLGIVGSYAWRTYENTKERPLNVVLDIHAFGGRAI